MSFLLAWLAVCAAVITLAVVVIMVCAVLICARSKFIRDAVGEYQTMLTKLNGVDWAKEHFELWQRNHEKDDPNIEYIG